MLESFTQKQNAQWAKGKFVNLKFNFNEKKTPKFLQDNYGNTIDRHLNFALPIVDATKDLVFSYSFNPAFYEQYGTPGLFALKRAIEHIKQAAPYVPIILDAKKADNNIEANEAYAVSAFDHLKVDAITVNPYFGSKVMKPFLDRKDKGIIVICRTSNSGAGEFQNFDIHDVDAFSSLHKMVARIVSLKWNTNGNCMLVVDSKYSDELRDARKIAGDMPIFISGIGMQGGYLEKFITAGFDSKKEGIIADPFYEIIYTSSDENFAEAARSEIEKLNNKILTCRDALNEILIRKVVG